MINVTTKTYGWVFDNPAKFEQVVRTSVAKVAPELPKLPKAKSRVRTGRMAQSWQSENLGNAIRVSSEGVAYTIFNNEGTRFMSAQPMLTDSVSVPEMVVLLSNEITTQVKALS